MRDLVSAVVVGLPFLAGAVAAPPAVAADVVCRFADSDIVESSGLVVRGQTMVTVNDSGDSARVFEVDRRCVTVREAAWDAEAVDIEALAPAPDGAVWVGDIGDNAKARSSVTVTRVSLASSAAESFTFTYPDGPLDAEALLSHPGTGRLYVVSKGVFGGTVFEAPATLSSSAPNRLQAIGDAPGLVTDGAFFPDGRHLILRDYGSAAVFTFPGLERLGTFALPQQQQGEGIAVSSGGEVFLSSEGVRAPVLRVALPAGIASQMEAPAPSPSVTPDPEPIADPSVVEDVDRDPWQWALGGLLGLVALGVLLRALRPR